MMSIYRMNSVMKRLKQLEQQYGSNIPEVIAEFADGTKNTYKGIPPAELLFDTENPTIKTSGSKFADLVNVIINPEYYFKAERLVFNFQFNYIVILYIIVIAILILLTFSIPSVTLPKAA